MEAEEDIEKIRNDLERVGFGLSYNGSSSLKGRKIKILDSTLREGEQFPGCSFTNSERVQIAWTLDFLGVDAIEISPVISDQHMEACKKIVKAGLKATIVAHGRTLKKDIDQAVQCDAGFMAMYHSVSDIHLKYKLHVSREQALSRTLEAVDYAKKYGLKLRVTLEDASRADPNYVIHFARELEKAHVDRISLPDTIGIMTPGGMYRLVKMVKENVKIPLDVHCHNDMGLALANSIAGLEAGAEQIHVTANGLGERVGIPDLSQASLVLKLLYGADVNIKFSMLFEFAKLVEEYTGIPVPNSAPLVGGNAYKHKAGTHVAAVIKNPKTYELISPKVVGNRRRLVFGGLIGKNGAEFLLKMFGIEAEGEGGKLVSGLKDLGIDLFELELTEEMEELLKREGGILYKV
ncbi:MAG: homocitrate synthase/isopropylmalate synthase family protein [Nitrososphaeria archaeon]